MNFEAAFYVRKRGAIGEFALEWLTVPTNDRHAAIDAFHALGYETRGGTVMTQEEAAEQAAKS